MFCPLLPSLLHGRRRRANAKMLKIHWFLWVASHMRLFSGSARSNQISEGTRSKKRLNISSKMRTQGTNIDVQKKHFLGQNGSQNGPRRPPETCAEDGRQLKRAKRSLGRLRGGKKKAKTVSESRRRRFLLSQRGSSKGSVRGE